ncbi:uncharacterized protein LOC106084701 [Stomoxys calcitrans]|uniref:uncharacterized protein LOC106084701 n=1 Tax=Stomoxys calcitrans TaxID=35570 RepID=UPI0027E35411|nr:uncharacterized protein LOC106084701 [Stomoxys calcitrans]
MKFLVALTIFALFEINPSDSSPARYRRSDQFVQRFEKLGTLSKRLIPQTEAVIKLAINKIPTTNAYTKYRQDLQSYLSSVNHYHTKRGGCYEKSFNLIGQYASLMERYEKPNALLEAKRVKALLKESGSDNLSRDLDEWIDAYEKSNFDVESENLSSSDTKKVMALLQEVC